MIIEAYVSYKVAKLLKEKGFDIPCHSHYWEREGGITSHIVDYLDWNKSQVYYTSRPTHQMALDWLRKVHNIHIVVEPEYHLPFKVTGYIYNIHCLKETWVEAKETYKTYEEATEAAIKYSFENLI